MRLNSIKTYISVSLLAGAMFACSEDKLDTINKNPDNAPGVDAKFILTDAITSTAFYNIGNDFNHYFASYVEHEVGVFNQLYNAEMRQSEVYASSTFNNAWMNAYSTLKNARIIIDKCSDTGTQPGNYTTKGMGEVLAALKGMKDLDVQPYVDKVSNEPLMKEAPKGGSIVNEDSNGIYGTTVLTLSNGIKVYLKNTDFKADEIRMRGFSVGGSSQFEDKDKLSFTSGVLNGVVEAGGAGNFSNVELTKMLAGKKVSVSAGVNGTEEYVQGNCSPKDFETMLQLTYLYTTAPRKDMEAFNSLKTRLKAQLESRGANPISTLLDTIQQEMYGASPRFLSLKPEMVDQLDYDHILELYKDRFADMGDFSFFFVGNIDIETAKPLIAQYLGSLPSAGRKETVIDRHMDIAKGNIENIFAKEQQTPMATVAMVISGTCRYDLKNNVLMSYLSQALDMVYTEEIREKEGGSYGVSTYGVLNKFPKEMVALQIIYQTDPAKFENLNGIINRELEKMAANGPSEEKMQKIKEYMLKKHADNQKENSYWLNNLHEYFSTGVDNTQDYEALINGITAKDVQQFTANLLKQNNKITVVMTVPEE